MSDCAGGTLPQEQQLVVIKQGTDMGIGIPVISDLTGYAVRSQLRRTVGALDVVHEWSTANELAEIKPWGILLHCPASLTVDWDFSSAVMDVELTAPNEQVSRVASYRVRLSREVTR